MVQNIGYLRFEEWLLAAASDGKWSIYVRLIVDPEASVADSNVTKLVSMSKHILSLDITFN